jgi:hypothetical protein
MQTVKFASVRASADPDRDSIDHGIYYGNNIPGGSSSGNSILRIRTTRAAFRKRVSK